MSSNFSVGDAGFTVREGRWADFSADTLNAIADILEAN